MANKRTRVAILVVVIAVVGGLWACGPGGGRQARISPTPTKTPKPTFTATLTPTLTPIPTDTPLPTDTPTPEPPTNTPIIVTATDTPAPTATPTATPTKKPTARPRPTSTRTPIPAPTKTPTPQNQWSGLVVWDPNVAPNCNGPGISGQSVIKDKAGNPLNNIYVTLDCYGNRWLSLPSGPAGGYAAGHYDFSLGQTLPQAWTCTIFISDALKQPVQATQIVQIAFDTASCVPRGTGHQVAIVNWTKNY